MSIHTPNGAVRPQAFVDRMRDHWTGELSAVATPQLEEVWRSIGAAYFQRIEDHGNQRDQWTVLKPETGTGKSQGTMVYCSMLPRSNHPGALIVTRMKADADAYAATINRLAGWNMALACHTDNPVSQEVKRALPVLMVTHAAYTVAMDLMNRDVFKAWNDYRLWHGNEAATGLRAKAESNLRERKLVVIDEALEFVKHHSLLSQQIVRAIMVTPNSIRRQFTEHFVLLDGLARILEEGAQAIDESEKSGDRSARLIIPAWHRLPLSESDRLVTDMSGIVGALEDRAKALRLEGSDDPLDNSAMYRKAAETFKSAQYMLHSWAYLAAHRDKKKPAYPARSLNTAHFLVPDLEGGVVLDATAQRHTVYDLLPRCSIRHTPRARRYDNVNLNISWGHNVGKRYMITNKNQLVRKLFPALMAKLPRSSKVLIVCHKDVEDKLQSHRASADDYFEEVHIAHWHALDGKNDWQHCDNVVLFGLPYPPKQFAPNVFMAIHGPQKEEWLNGEVSREYKNFKDILLALEQSFKTTRVIQAVNRIVIRRVTEGDGGCQAGNIWIMLPDVADARSMVAAIREEMPGLKENDVHWFSGAKSSKKSDHEESLVKFLEGIPTDQKVRVLTAQQKIGASKQTMDRLVARLKDQHASLARAAQRLGITYTVERVGRTNVAFFIKDPFNKPA